MSLPRKTIGRQYMQLSNEDRTVLYNMEAVLQKAGVIHWLERTRMFKYEWLDGIGAWRQHASEQ